MDSQPPELSRRQLLRPAHTMFALCAVLAALAGWQTYADRAPRRSRRQKRRKWQLGALALLWLGLGLQARRQRSSSIS